MGTPEFRAGLGSLLELGSRSRIAIMCAEAPWWRCHRALIADALIAQGFEVLHILDGDRVVPHPGTAPARIVDGRLSYPAVPAGGK